MSVLGGPCVPVRCGHCAKSAATMLHDGSVQIESRHNGNTHITVLSLRDIVRHAGKKRVEEILRTL